MAVLNYHNFDTLGYTSGSEGPNQFYSGPQTSDGYEDIHIRLDDDDPLMGDNCCRFEIVDGLYRPNYPLCRSEIRTQVFGGYPNVMQGWYSFSFKAGTLNTGQETAVISQLWDGGSPTISLRWRFSDNQIFSRIYNPNGPNLDNNLFIASNDWVNVDVYYRARENDTGILKIWVDGNLVADRSGVITSYDPETDGSTPYWKLGIYSASFGEGNLENRVAFFDMVSYHDDEDSEQDTLDWIANFRDDDPDPEEYTISVSSTTGGNATGGGVFEEDDTVTLTATPNSGYEFIGWEEDESIVSTNNPYIFNAEEDRTLLAIFELISPEEYTINVTAGTGGSVSGGGTYEEDDEVTLTATPFTNYVFDRWVEDSSTVSTANPYIFNAEENRDIVAEFTYVPIEPTAVADSDITTGNIPLTVQFDGSDSLNAVFYFWDFGDGNTSTEESPQHTYTAIGVYDVELTVTSVDDLEDNDDSIQITAVQLLTEFYVSNNGNDNNDGSISNPVQTIGRINEILLEGIDNSVNFNRGDVFKDGLEIPTVNDGTISNPIEFKPYGSGSIPKLSGFKEAGTFSNVSGNIYQVQDNNFPSYIHKLRYNGDVISKARLPKEGWLRADSNDNSSITSTNLPSVDYSGGEVEAVVWKMQWIQDTVKVINRVSNTLNYTGGSSYPTSARTDGRYYIQNAIECLTENGDWMFDTGTKTLTIYSSTNPNSLDILYSSGVDGIEGIGNTYNSYSELSLEGSINGVDLDGANNNTVYGLVISNQANEGIAVRNSANVVVSDNEISDADVRGISFTDTSSSPIVFRNKVSNIALNTGNPLANGDEKGNGIYFSNSENIDCQLNEVINVGFNGIRYNHNNALITRNIIEGFCRTKHDGAGIYTYGGASGANTHTDRVVSRNVVSNGGDPLRPNTYGIYIDDNSENISHVENLVKDTWNAGFYIHNSHDLSFDGDIVYGCGTLFKFGQDGSNELIRDNTISNMVFVLTSKSDFGFEILSNANDVSSFFNINNNTYIVASNNQLVFTTRYVSTGKTFFNNVDFEGWQALGNDTDSSIRYLNIPEYSIISEGSNKWNGTVGNHHQGGVVTVNVDGSNVEVLMTSESPTTTRAEIHFRLDGVESDKDYIVRFRARALSGHQSLNLYMRQSNAPYRDLGGKTAAVVGSEWQDFEFLVSDLIAEETSGYLIDCQSNQGTLEIDDFEFVEAEVEKTVYEDYILPVSNMLPFADEIEVGIGWKDLDGEEVSEVELGSFESTILLSDDIPVQEYEITVTQTSGGNATGGGVYEEDDPVTLTATPDTGYEFVRWEEDSSIVSTANPYIFNAEGNRTLVAVFQEIEYQLTVTYTAGGTATGSGEYKSGEQVQLTATPNSGYSFTGWYRDSTLLSTDNPYNYTTRGQADTVQARFELIPIPEFTITVIPSTGGTVSGGGVYEEGQAVTLSAMPQSGWTFVKWSNEATANPYSFTVSENITISAIFEEVNPEVPYIIVKGKFKIV